MTGKGKVFLLDDDELIITMLSRVLKKEGYEVYSETKAHDIINKIRSWSPKVILLDVALPERNGIDILRELKGSEIDTEVIMLTADDTAETAVTAMKLGAMDYLTKPFNIEEVKIVIDNAMEKEKLKEEVDYLRRTFFEFVEKDIVGESPPMKELKSKIEKIAEARVSTVLITGESGTGKEVVARQIHSLIHQDCNPRCVPFVGINCSAMPEHLLESEFFGYEKGSFTDARSDKKGLFEVAKGGTVLLDEIADMRASLQSKLLRALEERTIRRLGGKDDIHIDVTIIATTNRNISEAVEKGEFRKDLFFRLSTFYLHVLPLRERKEDIPLLARHFLSHYAKKYNKRIIKDFSPEVEKLMTAYSWPGNVRELKNLVERLVVLENTEIIQPQHMPKWLVEQSPITVKASSEDKRFILPESGLSLDELEKDLILQAVERTNHNMMRAAKLLNVSYDTLRYQLKKFGIK